MRWELVFSVEPGTINVINIDKLNNNKLKHRELE